MSDGLEIDDDLLPRMREFSSAIQFEVRHADDDEAAHRGLHNARAEVFAIPHPDQPDGPFATFASDVEPGARGPGFWVDMADAEAYDGILEEVLERVLSALAASGLRSGCLTWPDSRCERTSAWRPVAPRGRLDLAYASDDPASEPVSSVQQRPSRASSSLGWSSRSPLPTPRARPGIAMGADGRIYVLGGASRSSATVKTVEIYDPPADAWSRGPSLRIARRGPGAALGPDGRLYAIGGYPAYRSGPTTAEIVITVEAYDPAARRWDEVAPIPAPALNEIGAATGPDGRIYALSSRQGDSLPCFFYAYDAAADGWTPLAVPDADYPPWGPTVLTGPDGRIYATGDIRDEALIVDAYDPATDTWERVPSPEHPRSGFGAALAGDGRMHLVGGLPAGPGQAYDAGSGRWEECQPMATARTMLSAVAGADGHVYAIGGYAGNRLVGDVDAYAVGPQRT